MHMCLADTIQVDLGLMLLGFEGHISSLALRACCCKLRQPAARAWPWVLACASLVTMITLSGVQGAAQSRRVMQR